MEAIENLRDLAIRAHQGTSFSPEERGAYFIKKYSADLADFLSEIPEEHHDWATDKYIRLLSNWWHSKSRCISSMITGPANFPSRRAQKLNNWEQGHYDTFYEWRISLAAKLKRKAARALWSVEGEIHRLDNELEFLKTYHERMKSANKILQSKRLSDVEKLEEIQNIGFHDLQSINGFGFVTWQLTNNLAKIKTREARIAVLQKRLEARSSVPEEKTMNGIRVVENIAENRLQLFFESIPAPAARSILKRNGYRWSHKNQCWQSFLSGKSKLNRVLSEIEKN